MSSMHHRLGEAAKTYVAEAAAAPASLALGKVTRGLDSTAVELEIDGGGVVAQIGFGCLVQPIPGDRVLAAQTSTGIFVIAVIERLVPDMAALALPNRGALAIEAANIRLVARNGRVSVDASDVEVHAGRFNLIADSLTLLSRMGNWIADHLRISAKTVETVANTHSVKAVDRVAVIEGTDILRAQSVSQAIENVAVTNAPAVVIATTEDLRLDGKRVTVG